jgi:hypothetical protein
MSYFKLPDKTYYITGEIDKQVEEFRSRLNNVLYIKNKTRNVKKYELLNVLTKVGLDHISEVLVELGLIHISEEELK